MSHFTCPPGSQGALRSPQAVCGACAPSIRDETTVALCGDQDVLELCHKRIAGTGVGETAGRGERERRGEAASRRNRFVQVL